MKKIRIALAWLSMVIPAASAAAPAPLEQTAPERAAGIRKAAAPYDYKLVSLVPKEGVRFYRDLTLGKWGWTGMPVAATRGDKTFLVSLDNVGSFFGPIRTADQAYELATFIPSYWKYSKKSVKRRGKGWIVEVDAAGMNASQRTVFTFEVSRDGGCRQTGNSDPKADPTEGIRF